LKIWGIDNDNTELWKHRGFGTSWLPGGDGFLGECNQRYWLLLRKEAQGFFRISFSPDSEASRFSIALISSGDLPD
jgi:hypothetical protein